MLEIDTPLERFWGSQWGPRAPKGLHFGGLWDAIGSTVGALVAYWLHFWSFWGSLERVLIAMIFH